MYVAHVENNFDLDAIRNSGLDWAYDAMYGAGQNVMRRMFPDITFLHSDHNPGFDGQAPEPIQRNLKEFEDIIKMSEGEIASGLVTDGDADRIGLYDQDGKFCGFAPYPVVAYPLYVQSKRANRRGLFYLFAVPAKSRNFAMLTV